MYVAALLPVNVKHSKRKDDNIDNVRAASYNRLLSISTASGRTIIAACHDHHHQQQHRRRRRFHHQRVTMTKTNPRIARGGLYPFLPSSFRSPSIPLTTLSSSISSRHLSSNDDDYQGGHNDSNSNSMDDHNKRRHQKNPISSLLSLFRRGRENIMQRQQQRQPSSTLSSSSSSSSLLSSRWIQIIIVVSFYVFHTTVLTQAFITFPIQLIPNDKGHFGSIGLDSIAGMISFALYLIWQNKKNQALSNREQSKSSSSVPWRDLLLQQQKAQKVSSKDQDSGGNESSNNHNLFKPPTKINRMLLTKSTSCIALFLLTLAYFWTGRVSLFWEDALYALAGIGFVMTIPMHRSLCVLLGHLTWVFIGSCILGFIPRPAFFVRDVTGTDTNNSGYDVDNDIDNDKQQSESLKQQQQQRAAATPLRWYRRNDNDDHDENVQSSSSSSSSLSSESSSSVPSLRLCWWVIGGYCISSWFFNIADCCNQYILPEIVLQQASDTEGVVTQLINPEYNDILASLVGYIAPCITAPWWEEILYRGFCLPALALNYQSTKMAVLVSGIVFSAHHMQLCAALPLAVLGWAWSWLYIVSDNIWTTIIIHALWNSRVFLSSWFGL